jgi:ferredoxin
MFREEIEDLKNLHMGRLARDPRAGTGRAGDRAFHRPRDGGEMRRPVPRLDRRGRDGHGLHLRAGADDAGDRPGARGPRHGEGPDQIRALHLRRAAGPPAAARTTEGGGVGKAIRLSVTLDGATRSFEMSPDQTVLEAALAHDIDVPFSCRAGVCSTCRCKVTEGEVAMDTNHALEDYEVAQGFALSCQSRPLSDRSASITTREGPMTLHRVQSFVAGEWVMPGPGARPIADAATGEVLPRRGMPVSISPLSGTSRSRAAAPRCAPWASTTARGCSRRWRPI